MFSNIIYEDLRTVKTKNSLYAAMFSLLEENSFRKITVKSICEEALISRASFYAHFLDKYDLLKYWMTEFWLQDFAKNYSYKQIEKAINHHIDENLAILKNLVCDADDETFGILFNFILSTVNITVERNNSGEMAAKNVIFANFYAGGIISYFLWQVKNRFPADVPLMNKYLFKMIHDLQSWQ